MPGARKTSGPSLDPEDLLRRARLALEAGHIKRSYHDAVENAHRGITLRHIVQAVMNPKARVDEKLTRPGKREGEESHVILSYYGDYQMLVSFRLMQVGADPNEWFFVVTSVVVGGPGGGFPRDFEGGKK